MTGEEELKTGSRRGAVGANRDLGSRSRAERQRAQGRAVEADRSGQLSSWTVETRTEEGRNEGATIAVLLSLRVVDGG